MGGGRWRIFFHPTHPWTTSLFSPPHLILFPPTTSPTSRGNACHQVTAAKSTRQTTQKLYIFFAITLPLTPPAIHHTLSHTTTYCHPYQSLPHSTPNPVLSIFSSLVIYSSSPLHFTTCLLWNTNAQRVISAKRTTPSLAEQADRYNRKKTYSMCQNHTHHIHTHITHITHITSTHTSHTTHTHTYTSHLHTHPHTPHTSHTSHTSFCSFRMHIFVSYILSPHLCPQKKKVPKICQNPRPSSLSPFPMPIPPPLPPHPQLPHPLPTFLSTFSFDPTGT